MTDLTERLRDYATCLQGAAWSRQDGGQDLSIGSMLAEEAATTLETLTQENARLREAGWRDIESAPKDGTQFLALVSNGWYAIARAPAEALQKGWPYQWWLTSDRQSYPVVETHSEDSSFGMTLEYWMPLPPAPARKALGGGDE